VQIAEHNPIAIALPRHDRRRHNLVQIPYFGPEHGSSISTTDTFIDALTLCETCTYQIALNNRLLHIRSIYQA